nr:MAG TPA: hypothetical protein [Caudoviricetes sp.]
MCVDTAGSIPRAATYSSSSTVEQRSPKPQVDGPSPSCCAICVPYEGAAQ